MTETVSRAGAEVRPLILAGGFRDGAEVTTVVFPYDGSEVARVALADESTVEAALTAAAKAAPRMATVPPFRRAEILHRAAALVASREEELARQMTLETGNAVWETRLEVQRTVEILTIAAEEARRITGEAVPVDALPRGEGRFGITRRFPVGPVVGITPFNAPLLLVAHKLAPAFAAGNPCIIRPATKTPLSALALGQVFVEAGAPEGSVSVIPCRTELAERLACDERVKLLTFTGSCAIGWKLRRIAATPRVTLELGGNGAVIINRDANLEYAAERCAFGGFLRAGQACISVQRLYVHRDVFDAFTESFLGQIRRLVVGDPLDESTVVGGLVDEAAAEKTMALIDEAKAAGAQVLCGGNRQGTLVEPTVVVDAPEDLRIAAEEAFAPVVALYPYDDFDDALARANDTQFGLQAGLFTNDIRLIHRAFETLEVGGLIVNDVNTFRVDHMPYGGVRKSGFGREGIRYAIREMTEERLLVIDPR